MATAIFWIWQDWKLLLALQYSKNFHSFETALNVAETYFDPALEVPLLVIYRWSSPAMGRTVWVFMLRPLWQNMGHVNVSWQPNTLNWKEMKPVNIWNGNRVWLRQEMLLSDICLSVQEWNCFVTQEWEGEGSRFPPWRFWALLSVPISASYCTPTVMLQAQEPRFFCKLRAKV